ncbi:Coiled-coil domain-containing protein 6 [Smittium culicis]|uniref:Coiled-coil domain-containing protein 6 n=1 Tax=Smittium culicis TaxID=133412 RepID=A0A1R1X0S9_9FUNG|nr:Coiled-coil domain-containing protein 6 [Smittium culicis]
MQAKTNFQAKSYQQNSSSSITDIPISQISISSSSASNSNLIQNSTTNSPTFSNLGEAFKNFVSFPNCELEDKDLEILLLKDEIDKLKQEKVDLENSLEQEQERLVNKLNRQFDIYNSQPIFVQNSGLVSPGAISNPINSENNYPSFFPNDSLKSEIITLRYKQIELEKELFSACSQNQLFKAELFRLRNKLDLPTDDLAALQSPNPTLRDPSPYITPTVTNTTLLYSHTTLSLTFVLFSFLYHTSILILYLYIKI